MLRRSEAPLRPIVWSDIDAGDGLHAAWPALDESIDLRGRGDDAELRQAFAVIVRRRRIGQSELDHMPVLRLISCWGVGYDHIDLGAASARGIPVVINPVFTNSVAEAAITLLLALHKRLPQLIAAARAGTTAVDAEASSERNREVAGKTLGVIGFGRIGRAIGEMARGLGMTVVASDPALSAGTAPAGTTVMGLDDVLASADAVVLAAALTDATHHLIDRSRLARMRPGGYIVNVGRGSLIDEAALYEALVSGHLAGAGLDVWEREPVEANHPLLGLPNVIGTPHALARSHESYARICAAIRVNIERVLEGRPPENIVNEGAVAQA